MVSVLDARQSNSKQSGRIQRLYVRGEIVLRGHTIVRVRVRVRVRVHCVCLVVDNYTTRYRLIFFNKQISSLQVMCGT